MYNLVQPPPCVTSRMLSPCKQEGSAAHRLQEAKASHFPRVGYREVTLLFYPSEVCQDCILLSTGLYLKRPGRHCVTNCPETQSLMTDGLRLTCSSNVTLQDSPPAWMFDLEAHHVCSYHVLAVGFGGIQLFENQHLQPKLIAQA